jgi:uncharacterized protein YcbK (DUF882 family)
MSENKLILFEHFDIRELVPKEIYEEFGIKSVQFIDLRIVRTLAEIRKITNKPIIVNNWHEGGAEHNRGFRFPNCTEGAKLSQHKQGRAIDFCIEGIEPEVIREAIRSRYDYLRGFGLTTIEKDTPSWVHIDCRETREFCIGLYEVNYN